MPRRPRMERRRRGEAETNKPARPDTGQPGGWGGGLRMARGMGGFTGRSGFNRPAPAPAPTPVPQEEIANPYAGTPYEGITEGAQYYNPPPAPTPSVGAAPPESAGLPLGRPMRFAKPTPPPTPTPVVGGWGQPGGPTPGGPAPLGPAVPSPAAPPQIGAGTYPMKRQRSNFGQAGGGWGRTLGLGG